jgi:signal peptidase II
VERFISIFLVIFTLLVDQISKFAVVRYLSHEIEVNSFFNLVLVYNKGISFGLFNDFIYSNYLFAIIAVLIVAFLCHWLYKTNLLNEKISLGLIIGGAVGNLIDRIIYPGVVDFIQIHWQKYYWPSFNIADSAICLGVCILLIFSIDYKHSKKEKNDE